MKLRTVVVTAHRWTSLVALLFWLLQALTGIFAVFHWEIDDAIVAGAHRATDFSSIERTLPQGVSSMWTSAGAADRYDVNLPDRVVRIDGAGNALRVRPDGTKFAAGGFVETLVTVHHDLLAGDAGRVVVGISGLLLLANLIMGIVVAWPRAGQWGRALRPLRKGTRVALLYSWHRALGLWLAVPALCLITAGVLMAFIETTDVTPREESTAPRTVGMANAVSIARGRFPDAVVSGVNFPTSENAVWRITLKQRQEPRRAYGKTRVWVSAIDGRILGAVDALHTPAGRRIFDSLFAFHTGEMGGIVGRIFVVLTGVWLIAMILLGSNLWTPL